MKKTIAAFFAGCFAVCSAKAGLTGENFVVTHPTAISAFGAYDGGTGFTSTETVGIFNDVTGNLVGSAVVFGPGSAGTQLGNTFYENVPEFVLSPGDYSIIFASTGSSSPGGSHLSGGNSYENLGSDVDLPGGGRFNSGSDFIISLSENSGSTSPSSLIVLVDPPTVPDGGTTAMLLGASLAGLGWLRRRI
jgi:VPDSG-CTERM motif